MSRKARKRTPELDARVRAARAEGATYAELAARHAISEGLVRTILREAPAPTLAAAASHAATLAPAVETDEADGEITEDEVRGFLGAQIRRLQHDVANAPDATTRAAANRSLLAAMKIWASLRPDDEKPEGVWITREQIEAEAAKARQKFYALAENLVRVSESPAGATIQKLLAERRAEEAEAEKTKRGGK